MAIVGENLNLHYIAQIKKFRFYKKEEDYS